MGRCRQAYREWIGTEWLGGQVPSDLLIVDRQSGWVGTEWLGGQVPSDLLRVDRHRVAGWTGAVRLTESG